MLLTHHAPHHRQQMCNTNTNATPNKTPELRIRNLMRWEVAVCMKPPNCKFAQITKSSALRCVRKRRVQQGGHCTPPHVSPIITERRHGRELNCRLSLQKNEHTGSWLENPVMDCPKCVKMYWVQCHGLREARTVGVAKIRRLAALRNTTRRQIHVSTSAYFRKSPITTLTT